MSRTFWDLAEALLLQDTVYDTYQAFADHNIVSQLFASWVHLNSLSGLFTILFQDIAILYDLVAEFYTTDKNRPRKKDFSILREIESREIRLPLPLCRGIIFELISCII